jgi:hypothetical protein
MHTIWPFLWIWAYLYKPGQGWGAETIQVEPSEELKNDLKRLEELQDKVERLEKRLETLHSKASHDIEECEDSDDEKKKGAE